MFVAGLTSSATVLVTVTPPILDAALTSNGSGDVISTLILISGLLTVIITAFLFALHEFCKCNRSITLAYNPVPPSESHIELNNFEGNCAPTDDRVVVISQVDQISSIET